MEEVLVYFSLKYKGDFNKILQALKKKEKVGEDRDLLLKQVKCKYTTIISNDYPEALKQINCPPFVLYYYGDLEILKTHCIGVIGMRVPSAYGKSATNRFVYDLVCHHYTIVSGMALGIDTVAHRTALNNNGKTVAILGGGIDYCYPKRNLDLYNQIKENHLIISEYPGDLVPRQEYFPQRNRLIAGLSESLLVTEAKKRSGTMITVGFALDQGKEIFCVPGRITDNNGCNYLIQQGAKLVMSVHDLLDEWINNIDKVKKNNNNSFYKTGGTLWVKN